jgi:hypothetical protein
MFEKRKNSDKRAGISFILATVLIVAGIFVGFQMNEDKAQDSLQEAIVSDIDVSGEWIGTTIQDYDDNLRYDMQIVFVQDGTNISGYSSLDMIGNREVDSQERIEGYVEGDTIYYQEVETLMLVNTTFDYWCLTQATLSYQTLNGQETLIGDWQVADWEREECAGISGRIILTRQPE